MASAIDLDHFVMAKSYTLKDALSLPKRPPLHSTSILIPILPIMFIIALYYPLLSMLPFIATISVVSHHVRDGHRRGVWFWPVGSTPAIPYWLYLLIIILLPLSTSLIVKKVSSKENVTSEV
ncbi:transmembrane 267-like [Paramuricea clavata]|uniref:Transmembrane protein 267 n=1 Tax=Paramuricea clavata TaxID=317549 RepID=A0A7D9DMM6_PARCT|nr:transmembrane 267-like [Paramuricea clavata]